MQDAMDFGFQIFKLAGSLSLVLALLLLGVYGLKRWGHWLRKSDDKSIIQVQAQHAFGPKHFLMVVRVHQQSFLVGVSPQGMQMLSPIAETPAAPVSPKEEQP